MKLLILLSLFIATIAHGQDQLMSIQGPDEQRVKEIEKYLSEGPQGFGRPINERKLWKGLLLTGQFTTLMAEADELAALPFPRLTEEIYFSYFEGNDSETSKKFITKRRIWLSKLVLAECLSGKGEYLPAIHRALNDLASTRSWSFPAEDRNRSNYEGTTFTIALSSSSYGFEIAQTLYLLGDKVNADLRQKLMNDLNEKIFQPVLDAVNNGDKKHQYTALTNKGNYNPVTLANVTGAALATIVDKRTRAVFISIAERYSHNYLLGFSDDGYCSEGIGYYNYGFGHYVLLRELLSQTTGGKVDLFKRPKVYEAARFIPSIQIMNNIYPAIADSEQNPMPDRGLMYYLNRHFKLELPEYDNLSYRDLRQFSLLNLMYLFPNCIDKRIEYPTPAPKHEIRHYFDKAGVAILRPFDAAEGSLAIAIKGGNNAEMHNHNDLGSFSLVVGKELLIGDPGTATYTPKYFGSERYKLFKTTASYGHPVPLINGKQQRSGREATAHILNTSFKPERDMLMMDLRSAYPDTSLNKIIRSFTYVRTGNGSLIIRDEFAFNSAGNYETGLITRFPWKPGGKNEILIGGRDNTLKISLRSFGASFQISDEIIDEGPEPYTRIGIRLTEPTPGGWLEMIFESL